MSKPIWGFTRVERSAEELASGRGRKTGMLACDRCGQRIEAAGMGIGSHRRRHDREDAKPASLAKVPFTQVAHSTIGTPRGVPYTQKAHPSL